MNADRHNGRSETRPAEPLPLDFEPALLQVDQLLTRSAGISNEVPAGLSQRIYELTVESLPSAQQPQRALRLVDAEQGLVSISARWTQFGWGWRRVALAASVLLVAGVTLWVNWPRPVSPVSPMVNGGPKMIVPGPTQPLVQTASLDFGDLNRIAASHPSELDAFESEFTYLLDASDVRSFKDLNNDLRQFVAQLEM